MAIERTERRVADGMEVALSWPSTPPIRSYMTLFHGVIDRMESEPAYRDNVERIMLERLARAIYERFYRDEDVERERINDFHVYARSMV